MTEDLGQEDVIGHILGFKEVATDGAISASQVAGLPAEVPLAESDLYLVVECVLGGEMGALLAGLGTDSAQPLKGLQDVFKGQRGPE